MSGSTTSVSTSSSATFSSAPIPPVGSKAPIDASVVVHAKKLSGYTLYRELPNGERFAISLTKEHQNEIDLLGIKKNPTGAADFLLRLQDCVVFANGSEEELAEGDLDLQRMRAIANDAIPDNIVWKNFPQGHRASVTDSPAFECTSARLKTLQFKPADLKQSLIEAGPLPQHKLRCLKRMTAVKQLLKASKKIVEGIAEKVPPKMLETQSRKQRLAAINVESGTLPALLAFEATHPVELDSSQTPKEQAESLRLKQGQAKAWIEQHEVPKLESVIDQLKQRQRRETVDEREETHCAEDLARLGCQTRTDYRLLKAEPRREGPELFYARLMEAVEKNDPAEIKAIIDGPLFSLVFDKLHVVDQADCREQLKAAVVKMANELDVASKTTKISHATWESEPENRGLEEQETDKALIQQFSAMVSTFLPDSDAEKPA